MLIRRGGDWDFQSYVGRPYSPDWCVDTPTGFVAEENGKIVAVAMVSRDIRGKHWLWYNARVPLSAVAIHRRARRLLDELREDGIGRLWCFCDEREPTAERWLRRLGFRPQERLLHPSGVEKIAWLCPLN